jgi:hypothetical protein
VDQPDAAAEAARFAAAMWEDLERSLELTAERLGTVAIPAGPRRRIDSGAIGSLVGCVPLDLLSADDPPDRAAADVIRQRFTLSAGRAFFQGISHTGLGTYLTLQLAAVELRAGDRRVLDRLAWMLDAATPTWTWPEAVHPRLDGGCMGDGHHGWPAAELLTFVLQGGLEVPEAAFGLPTVRSGPARSLQRALRAGRRRDLRVGAACGDRSMPNLARSRAGLTGCRRWELAGSSSSCVDGCFINRWAPNRAARPGYQPSRTRGPALTE